VDHFLGVFAKLLKVTISFVTSVDVEQLGSHWTDFHEILYLSIFQNSVKKIYVSLKTDKKNEYFIWRRKYIYDNILLDSSQNEKYFRQKF
jgi:hypothetical protein